MKYFKILISIISMLLTFQLKAYISVGNDLDCDYSDLQSAIISGETELRLSNQLAFSGSYQIVNSIHLIGGYNNCNEANQNILTEVNQTEILSDSGETVFSILSGGLIDQVILSNLDIHQTTQASAINISSISGTVAIINSTIRDNSASRGAGIYVTGSESQVILRDTVISNNQSSDLGGGLYCNGATVKLDSQTLFSNNQVFGTNSSGHGGGLYADNCQIEVYSGHSDGLSAGFISNKSSGDGAGLYVRNSQLIINGQQESEDIDALGDNTQPAVFKDNVSDTDMNGTGYGAAIYLRSTQADIKSVWMDSNRPALVGSFNLGSVLFAKYGSEVYLGQDDSQACWREGLCNLVTNNEHVAIVVSRSPTQATITHTEFANNTANLTSLIFVNNSTSFDVGNELMLTLEGNLFHHNVSDRVGLLKSNSNVTDHCCVMTINVFNNTITDNQFTDEIFDINDDTIFNMHGNIVYEDTGMNPIIDLYNSAFSDAFISCLMAHDVSSLPNIIASTVAGNPLFIDPINKDYHLSSTSPAIDFCDSSQYTPNTLDMDKQSRASDDETINNNYGPIDLGVDEYYYPEDIFMNGFEG